MVADMNPKPSPRYARPEIPMLKWYTPEKRPGRKFLILIPIVQDEYDLTGKCSEHQIVDT
jgi:hypothetical protein